MKNKSAEVKYFKNSVRNLCFLKLRSHPKSVVGADFTSKDNFYQRTFSYSSKLSFIWLKIEIYLKFIIYKKFKSCL